MSSLVETSVSCPNPRDSRQSGKDGNIGIRIPSYLSQLGVNDIECRVSDKVNFIRGLVRRGMSPEEAEKQYYAELNLFNHFSIDLFFTGSSNMKITSGIVVR